MVDNMRIGNNMQPYNGILLRLFGKQLIRWKNFPNALYKKFEICVETVKVATSVNKFASFGNIEEIKFLCRRQFLVQNKSKYLKTFEMFLNNRNS